MDVGEWIHENIKKQRMKLNCHLTTSLMDMYSKCGNLEKALEHYACMVDILGRAGLLEEAVEFIEKMPITPSASFQSGHSHSHTHSQTLHACRRSVSSLPLVVDLSSSVDHRQSVIFRRSSSISHHSFVFFSPSRRSSTSTRSVVHRSARLVG
ncbi:hypothetical protein LWI29_015007 [Acer saccharum]|uniref:Pentatricopeptide repeat-containing protein n=1 Tax=Acer saccharum TaxID=4024 RepID=A0AA39T2J5_ACESA|nr:hypothetical protein LWI29_015007 [Acer saccharum]